MEQLSAMDYSMVQTESSRSPRHIAMVFFYDQSRVDGGKVPFENIFRVFGANLHKSRVFRRKLTGDTRGLDTPYWMEDPDFDLDFHVRHIALPRPGNWRQLCSQVARLHSRCIDLRSAPWEAYVIEGLNNVVGLPQNSFALMLKVHHAAVDGVSMASMLNAIHSPTAEFELPEIEDDWQGEQEPSMIKVWSGAWLNNLRRPIKLMNTLVKVAPDIVKSRTSSSEQSEVFGSLKTRFNEPVSAHRVVDALILELARVKAIKDSREGITVNDVVLSVVGGALRNYLLAKNELPESSLITAVPLSARDPNDPDPKGNQISLMRVSLATDVEDPVQRLEAVCESARRSKEYTHANGIRTMLDISEGLFPAVIGGGFKVIGLMSASDDMSFLRHTIVSNVPGANVPLYLCGARLDSAFALGPLSDGMGLFHGVISFSGKISISFAACREMLPDPEFYRQCLDSAWNELEAAISASKKP